MAQPGPSGVVIHQTPGGATVTYQGRNLYSPHEPSAAIRRRVAALRRSPNTLYLAASPLLGYGLTELLETLPAESHVLVIEADPVLQEVARAHGVMLRCSGESATVTDSAEPTALLAALRHLGVHRFRRVVMVVLSAGYHLHRHHYQAVANALEAEIRTYWQNRLTATALARVWVRNLIENLAALPRCGDLADLGISGPVVVAGAGPSLDAARPWLHQHRRRYTLLAVDTAFPALVADGLRPDLVLSVDGQLANLFDFVPSELGTTPLIADLTCYPQVIRLASRCYLFASRFHPIDLFRRLGVAGLLPTPVPALGSVGVTALYAARQLTRGPLILAGLDFSFPGLLTHSRGSPMHQLELQTTGRATPLGSLQLGYAMGPHVRLLPDLSGSLVRTTLVLDGYRQRIASLVDERVACLPGTGLDVGARQLGKNWEPSAPPELLAPPPAADRPRFPRGKVARWLSEEEARLKRLGPEEVDPELLRELDYLHFHFPDAHLTHRDAPFLRRVTVHAAYYLERVRRAQTRLAN